MLLPLHSKLFLIVTAIKRFVWSSRHHFIPCVLIFIWCLPYITTGQKIGWGDFSFFAQAYEAIRINIVDYHQFPWWNPWVAGGVPLYANPQVGVFSLQTVLVIIFGAPLGLKLTIALFTYLGYFSMYLLLRRSFRIPRITAILLGLIWIFSSFFVSHLPSHFSFIWFLIAPLFINLSLQLKGIKRGVLFGLAFAIMAHSQIHNAFFHIILVCSLIVLGRFIFESKNRKAILQASLVAAGIFLILAGHRLFYTIQNVYDFPRLLVDPAQPFITSLLAPLLPISYHGLFFIKYPQATPYGWTEMSATIGLSALLALFICLTYLFYDRIKFGQWLKYKALLICIAITLSFFLIGFGSAWPLSPYSVLKSLPVFSGMRIASRWFIWMDLGLLVIIGLSIKGLLPKRSYAHFIVMALLFLGVGELFLLNVGYQSKILNHDVITATQSIKSYPFEQTYSFGETTALSNGTYLPKIDNNLPHFYREYESTTFNLGVIQANDALVDQNTHLGPMCSWHIGCNYVLSNNARVVYWSPGHVELQRTKPGYIRINANNSNYYVINGERNNEIRAAEPYEKFIINVPDTVTTIYLDIKPALL